jgi:hypothetical protein
VTCNEQKEERKRPKLGLDMGADSLHPALFPIAKHLFYTVLDFKKKLDIFSRIKNRRKGFNYM